MLVGHLLGGLVARLYAGQYPDEVAGMVFVDHAFHPAFPNVAKVLPPARPPMTLAPGGGGGIESDTNFSKLSSRDRELHLWAMSQTRNQMALQANHEMMPECVAQADAVAKEHSHPRGDKPLVDVSADEALGLDYVKLQTERLSLSQNSKQIIAEKSVHFVIINRPDAVIEAIRQVVQSVRNNSKL